MRGPLFYAELHYSPGGPGFSRLHLDWPALYADVPCRVRIGQDLPLLICQRHGQQFPCRLHSICITCIDPDGVLSQQEFPGDWCIDEPLSGFVPLALKLGKAGPWQIFVDAVLEDGRRKLHFRNQSSSVFPEAPLRVEVLEFADPTLPGTEWGDLQVHSSATMDMVEFGPPLTLLKRSAACLDLDWFCVTDHSYDLVRAQNGLKRDPAFPRWNTLLNDVRRLNDAGGVQLIAGEELSCLSLDGGVIHLLLLNPTYLLEGSSDGGGRFPWGRPEVSLREALASAGPHTLVVASHPGEKPGALEKLVLRRQDWSKADLRQLKHWQCINGGSPAELTRGLTLVRSLWTEGHRGIILAGNDSHGSFSINREIHIPALKLSQHRRHLFGNWRTGITHSSTTEQRIAHLRNGHVLLGNGPLLWFGRPDAAEFQRRGVTQKLFWNSPARCGQIKDIVLLMGDQNGERTLQHEHNPQPMGSLNLPELKPGQWLRATLGAREGQALCNPLRLPDE